MKCPFEPSNDDADKPDYVHPYNFTDRPTTPGLRFSVPEVAEQALSHWKNYVLNSRHGPKSSALAQIPWRFDSIRMRLMLPLNPERVFQWIHLKYGLSTEFVNPLGQRYQAHADPMVIQHVLESTDGPKRQLYRKSYPLVASWRSLGGSENTIASHGQAWRSRNRITRRYISSRMLDEPRMRDIMQQSSIHLRKSLESRIAECSGRSDFSIDLGANAVKTAVQALYGVEIEEALAYDIRNATRTVLKFCAIESFFPFDLSLGAVSRVLPVPSLLRLRRSHKCLKKLVDELLTTSKSSKLDRSILKDFSRSRNATTGTQLDDTTVRNETHFQILAVAETVPTWVSWTLAALSKNPLGLERVRAEIDAQFTGDVRCLKNLLAKLPLAQQALNEAGRLYTPKYTIVRRALEADVIKGLNGDVPVAKGTFMFLNCSVAHRLEEVYGTAQTGFPAHEFALDRLSRRNGQRLGPDQQQLPNFFFGGAARICSGRAFANWEALMMLATVVKNFDFQLDFPQNLDSGRASDFTLRLRGGFQFHFRPR